MAHYYPVFLDLRQRLCLVVGGGELAAGKLPELLAAGARVVVVAERPSPAIEALARAGRLRLRRRAYRDGDLAGAFLAIAAFDAAASPLDPSGTTNANDASAAAPAATAADGGAGGTDWREAVWREAERRGLPLNSIDDPRRSSFIAGSVLRRGDLAVAISTAGKAPALAVRLRQWLEGVLGAHHARFLELAGSVRAALAAQRPDLSRRRELWYRLVDSDVLDLLQHGDEPAARRRFAEILGVEPVAPTEEAQC